MFQKILLASSLFFISDFCFAGKLSCVAYSDAVNLGNFKKNQVLGGMLNEFQCEVNTTIRFGSAITYSRSTFSPPENSLYPLMHPNKLPGVPDVSSNDKIYCYRDTICTYKPLSKGEYLNLKLYYSIVTYGLEPGQYLGQFTLYQTPLQNQGPTEEVIKFYYYYSIDALPCSLDTKVSNVELNNLDTRLQGDPYDTASIILNCPSASEISVRLSPSDNNIINSSQGISSSSLPGLNIQAKWNSQEAISFNTDYTRILNAGQNNLDIRFYPKLASGSVQPTGEFHSDYTLTLDYK